MLVIHKPLDNTCGASITSKKICQGTPLAYSVTGSVASSFIQINEQDDEQTSCGNLTRMLMQFPNYSAVLVFRISIASSGGSSG
jgi:hypothetical protein